MEHKFGTVALMGPPNAGKSTFLNHVMGQKVAIVTPKPQTTRNRISGIWTEDEGQIVFLDTPGVHRLRGRMNKFLLQAAWDGMAQADTVVLMVDCDLYLKKPSFFDKEMDPLIKPLQGLGGRLLIGANKVDRIKDKRTLLVILAKLGETFPEAEIYPVSASTGDGVAALMKRILEMLPEGPPMFPEDQLSTVPLRFMASEIIREKLFMGLKQELPYQTTVEIEQWEEQGKLVRVNAVIYTAKFNHKGIIIGKQGANLKKVGQEAREEMEELLGCKVYLELFVKVREGWTEDPGFLRSLGFGE